MLKRIPKLSGPRLLLVVTAVIVGYFLVTSATTALRSQQLREDEDRLRAEISALQQRHDRLEGLHEYLQSSEYIESVAREQLGLVRKGESSIVIIPAPAPTPEDGEDGGEDDSGDDLWWETLIR